MNVSFGQNFLNKKNPSEYTVPPSPLKGGGWVGTKKVGKKGGSNEFKDIGIYLPNWLLIVSQLILSPYGIYKTKHSNFKK